LCFYYIRKNNELKNKSLNYFQEFIQEKNARKDL
jgi:hypothetical protein